MLVALVHVTTQAYVYQANTFVLPLFFFLSGVSCAFSRQEGFIVRRVRGLLTPYFIFGALSFLYWAALERHYRPPGATDVPGALWNLLYAGGGDKYPFNAPLWFLPCLFVIEAGFYGIRRVLPSRGLKILLLALCAVAGFALSGVAPFSPAFMLPFRLPWMLDTALLGIVFYAVGTVVGKQPCIVEKEAVGAFPLLAAACTGCALCIILAAIFPAPINLSELLLPNPVQFYCMSFAGIAGVSALAMRFPTAWLCVLGRNSLIIMCVHDPLKHLVLKGASVLSGMDVSALRAWPVSFIAMTAVTLALSMALAVGINKYLPWMIKGIPLPAFLQGRG
jgi:fucose 4-O-acetylase-like acetyltransferase